MSYFNADTEARKDGSTPYPTYPSYPYHAALRGMIRGVSFALRMPSTKRKCFLDVHVASAVAVAAGRHDSRTSYGCMLQL